MNGLRSVIAMILMSVLFAQSNGTAQSGAKPMTNGDVIRLVSAGMAEGVILTAIKQTAETAFDTSADALIALKEAGASDVILAAMLTAGSSHSVSETAPESSEAPPTSTDHLDRPAPGIYIDEVTDNGNTELVPLEPTVISRVRAGGGWATRFTFGIAKNEIVAELRGPEANLRTRQQQPTFYFYFDTDRGSEVSGPFVGWLAAASSPNEFVLLQMYQEYDRREMTIGAANAYGSSMGVESENTVPLEIERLDQGVYRVTPAEQLGPGEFCFFYAAGAGALQTAGVVAKLFDFGVE